MRNHVLFAHRIFNVLSQQLQIEEIGNPQTASAHLVFIGRTDSAGGGANFYAAGGVLRRQLDHAMVRKNYLCAVRHKKIAIDSDARFAKPSYFLQKGHGVENNAVADHTAATRP